MFTVYVLYSEAYDKLYIGYTSDLEKRLESHNYLSKKGFTAKYRPWKLIHKEYLTTKSEAIIREKQLKQGQGRAWIRASFINK